MLEITINFPIAVTANPQNYYFQMRKQDGSLLTPAASEFGSSGSSFAASTPTNSFFWTAPYAGNFYLEVVPTTTTLAAVNVFYLLVTRANGGTLVQAVDALRGESQILKYIKVDAESTIVLSNTQGVSQIALIKIADGSTIAATSTNTVDQNSYAIALADVGPYFAVFTYVTSGTVPTTISIMSNTFNCPYDAASTFTDLRKIFTPCTDQLGTASTVTPAPAIPVIPADHIPVYGDSLNQFANMTDTQPRHDLGTLAIGDTFTFHIYFRLQTNLAPLTFRLQIVGT